MIAGRKGRGSTVVGAPAPRGRARLKEPRLGSLVADADLLSLARRDAVAGLRRPEHAGRRAAVLGRYGKTLDLAEVG